MKNKGLQTVSKTAHYHATKQISIDLMYNLVVLAKQEAFIQLQMHVRKGEKWAIELIFKMLGGIFDKSWLDVVDLKGLDTTVNCKNDVSRIINELITKLLKVDTLSTTEAKELLKILSGMQLTDELRDSLASKLTDEELVKFKDIAVQIEKSKGIKFMN